MNVLLVIVHSDVPAVIMSVSGCRPDSLSISFDDAKLRRFFFPRKSNTPFRVDHEGEEGFR